MLKQFYVKNINNNEKIDVKAKDFESAINQVKIFDKDKQNKYIEISEEVFLEGKDKVY